MRRRVTVVVLAVAAFALLTSQVRLPERRAVGRLGAWTLAVLGPAQAALSRTADAAVRTWRLYAEIGQLRTENRRLREEVERLSAEVVRLREQAQATQRLERLLAFRRQLPGRAIAARVIGRDGSRWFAVILVDRGSEDGVRRNAPVVAADGLVGRVLAVAPTTAQVLLITDSRSAVGVVLQQSREAGIVEGQGHALLRLKYVARSSEIAPGELVVTSGLGGMFPRGLAVGSVETVVQDQAALYQEAAVRPAVNLQRLEEVLILIETRPDR
ncbi:MAG: rod shape-determining protein MreC [Armatimonadota bacterium]|nr:rod shape-determining protein MreC [Armatimonadota bacterium]MDR7550242.1 rod shape-determining protein MreC [Armatimonadota bacterium]